LQAVFVFCETSKKYAKVVFTRIHKSRPSTCIFSFAWLPMASLIIWFVNLFKRWHQIHKAAAIRAISVQSSHDRARSMFSTNRSVGFSS